MSIPVFENFIIVGEPEIKHLMEDPDFADVATPITPNEKLGIKNNMYLVQEDWMIQNYDYLI